MHILKSEDVNVPCEVAARILQSHTDNCGIYFDVDRMVDYKVQDYMELRPLMQEWALLLGPRYASLSPTQYAQVAIAVKNRFGLSEETLWASEHDHKISINSDVRARLIDDPLASEDLKRFCKVYDKISKINHDLSYLDQYLNLPLASMRSFDGHRMTIGKPIWSKLSTSRVSAKYPSVQNIARSRTDIITYPRGFIYVRADSGQIEPRITWSYFCHDPVLKGLITAYNDAYYGQLHYATMPIEELKAYQANPALITCKIPFYRAELEMLDNLHTADPAKVMELMERAGKHPTMRRMLAHSDRPLTSSEMAEYIIIADDRQDLKKLALSATYGCETFEGIDPKLVAGYKARIVQHPERLRLERMYQEMAAAGEDTCYSAFGSPITPEETDKYKKGTKAWVRHLVRCFINNPVQTTAADLMNYAVVKADQLINQYAKGYTYINFGKHDELAFLIDERDTALVDELSEMTAYQVDDWIPIYADREDGVKRPKNWRDTPTIDAYDSVAEEEARTRALKERLGLI